MTNTSTATVNVPVEKKWVGPAADKATVRLLAGGTDSGRSLELSDANGWKASFEGLPKYDASGAEIAYAVAEDAVDGYDSAVSGDAEHGFTVTNTSTAKVDVPVEKKWVGSAAEKATVRLLAGGADSGRSVELTEANGWKGTFSGLPKYDAKTGEEIAYTVVEDAVEGYDSAITGDAHDGFTVTNTYVGETGGPSSGAAGNGNTGNNGTGNSAVLASTGDTGIVAAAVLAATALVSLATALLARGSTALGRRRKQG